MPASHGFEGVEVGEVKQLSTCNHCERVVRIRPGKGGEVLLVYHRWKRVRCNGSGSRDFGYRRWSLQQRRRETLEVVSVQKVWVRVVA